MKSLLGATATALVFFGWNCQAEDSYLRAGIGPSFIQNNTLTISGSHESFNPGVRMDFALGTHLDENFSAEFETGVALNSLNSINGVPVSPREIDFAQYPFLVNVVGNIPTGTHWSPYVGIGIGGMLTTVDATLPTYNASDFTFAYQVQTGVQYQLNPECSLDFGYKFLGSGDHTFTSHGSPTKTTPFLNHSLMVSFVWQF